MSPLPTSLASLLLLTFSGPLLFSLSILFPLDLIYSYTVSRHFKADDSWIISIKLRPPLPKSLLRQSTFSNQTVSRVGFFHFLLPFCSDSLQPPLPKQMLPSLMEQKIQVILPEPSWSILTQGFLSLAHQNTSAARTDWPCSVLGRRVQWLDVIFWGGAWGEAG